MTENLLDDYRTNAQRFILPLFVKYDGKNHPASTGTLLTYKGNLFLVGAFHSLIKEDINNLYYLNSKNGEFSPIINDSFGYKVCKNEDIFIIHFLNGKMEGKNFFNLDYTIPAELFAKHFESNIMAWIGFPVTRQKIRPGERMTAENRKNKYIHHQDGKIKSTANRYLLIYGIVKELVDDEVFAYFPTSEKTIAPLHNGKSIHVPKLNGMSGGAFYVPTKERRLLKEEQENIIDNSYFFIGIGLRRVEIIDKEKSIYAGLSRYKLIELLDKYIEEYSIGITIY